MLSYTSSLNVNIKRKADMLKHMSVNLVSL